MTAVFEDKLKLKLKEELKSTFSRTIDNPVIKAHQSWELLSEQLLAVLGEEVHTQWFKNAKPLVLKNNILLVQARTQFSAQWINTHYQELIDTLALVQDSKLTCFFIAPKSSK